ncbi:hypothetical protein HZH68_012259 [Vespula germanica]|uniref:Uncharacterized protein n=1 Tax=Vespula germanica TaxID=30212 RepID=A0A834JJK6_VESGE|nr:hypothetical protein HZH68_012259 [Vespula germanica]
MVGKSLSTVTAEPPDLANAFYVIPTPSSSPASSSIGDTAETLRCINELKSNERDADPVLARNFELARRQNVGITPDRSGGRNKKREQVSTLFERDEKVEDKEKNRETKEEGIARERFDSTREIYPIAKVEGRCGMNKSITCSRGKVKFEELSQVPRKIYKLQLFSSSFAEKDTVHLQIRSSWQ